MAGAKVGEVEAQKDAGPRRGHRPGRRRWPVDAERSSCLRQNPCSLRELSHEPSLWSLWSLGNVREVGAELRIYPHRQDEIQANSLRTHTASCRFRSRLIYRLPAELFPAMRHVSVASSSAAPAAGLARSLRSDARSTPGSIRPPSSQILPCSSPVSGPDLAARDC